MAVPSRHYRRNFVAFLGDYVAFGLAFTFVSQTTILPSFVSQLTRNDVIVGLVSTVMSGTWLLPQLVFANLLTSKRRKKPFIILGAILGRPTYLLYAAALWLGLHHSTSLALIFLFATLILFLGGDSMSSVAWFDVLGKAMQSGQRGRLVSIGQATTGILGIGTGALIAMILGGTGPPFPYNYALLFALSGSLLLLGLIFLSLITEPDEPVKEERTPWRDYLPHLVGTLRHDGAFRRVITIQLLAGFDRLGLSFYILFATRELALPPATIGVFTTVQTIAGIVASLGLGAINERVGTHRVIQISTALALTAPLVGLSLILSGARNGLATTVIYAWVFLAVGSVFSSMMLGYYNYVLELAPPGQRPTYIGLYNTISGVLVVLPTVGGWVLASTSYGVLFAVTAAVLATAHVLSLRLPSARSAATPKAGPVI